MAELILARNPDDNQGGRFVAGSEALRAGDIERAQACCKEHADEYPFYWYELALSYLMQRNWIAAATALRLGFVANPYVADLLCGKPTPLPYSIWHRDKFEEPEAARFYENQYGMLWQRAPDGLLFVWWLFHHPAVMAERAAILACRESLLWSDGEPDRVSIERQVDLIARIDDKLSIDLIRERRTLHGELVWPWLHRG